MSKPNLLEAVLEQKSSTLAMTSRLAQERLS